MCQSQGWDSLVYIVSGSLDPGFLLPVSWFGVVDRKLRQVYELSRHECLRHWYYRFYRVGGGNPAFSAVKFVLFETLLLIAKQSRGTDNLVTIPLCSH